eukprot:scaffold382258_cov18-Prasinocladus_malaysianus.AAC.1
MTHRHNNTYRHESKRRSSPSQLVLVDAKAAGICRSQIIYVIVPCHSFDHLSRPALHTTKSFDCLAIISSFMMEMAMLRTCNDNAEPDNTGVYFAVHEAEESKPHKIPMKTGGPVCG